VIVTRHVLSVGLALSSVVAARTAEPLPLPESWAPFARSTGRRQPPQLLNWTYRMDRFHPSAEQYAWTEFAAGDKSVLLSGRDNFLCHNAASGFGRIGFYGGKASPAKLANVRMARLFICLPGESVWRLNPHSNDVQRIDRESASVTWTRPYRLPDGRTVPFSYTARPAGDGRVRIFFDAGIDTEEIAVLRKKHKFAIEFQLTVPKGVACATKAGDAKAELDATDAARHVTLDMGWSAGWRADNTDGSILLIWWLARRQGELLVDFHESSAPSLSPPPQRGEIDFWATDALHVPVRPGRNLLPNGSFEQGLKGWFYSSWQFSGMGAAKHHELGDRPQQELVADAKCGKTALRYRINGNGACECLKSIPVSLRVGRVHTLSLWAKGVPDPGSGVMTLGAGPSAVGEQNRVRPAPGRKSPRLWEALNMKGEWRRYSVPFVPDEGGVTVNLSGWGKGWVYVDGIQVEEGAEATELDDEPVYGRLVTADRHNCLTFGTPFASRLALSGDAGQTGTVRLRLLNFYQETVFERMERFALDARGVAEIPLAFDPERLGCGVFTLRADYSSAGREWTDYQRMEVLRRLGVDHPTAKFFGMFNFFRTGGFYRDTLARMRDFGMGGMSWAENRFFARGYTGELCRELGVVNRVHVLQSELPEYMPQAFGWRKPDWQAFSNDTQRIIRFIEDSAYRAGLACREDDTYWALGNEEELGHYMIRDRKDFEGYFQWQQAAYRGLRRAFDERGLKLHFGPTHGTCSFNPGTSRDTMENYLKTAQAHGFRYDFVSVHMYWAMDGFGLFGSLADRDENAQAFCDLLARYGYPETTPIFFTESSNMLPMYIPSWGACDWADHYTGLIPSAAFGNREFVHAASLARIYLMDFKRWPRLGLTHTWQRWLFFDLEQQPFAWPMVVNVLGRLFPDPRFVGDRRLGKTVRGYCFRPTPDARVAILAVWSTELDVENGARKGETLTMDLPPETTFVDLMGNTRLARKDGQGRSLVPLTSAPVFLQARDGAALLKALESAQSDRIATVERVWRDMRFSVPGTLPVTNRVSGSGKLAATATCSWSKQAFTLRIEVTGATAQPTLSLGIDGLGDARRLGVAKPGPDDSAYVFAGRTMRRTQAVNTQFADGTTRAADDAEADRVLTRSWRPSSDGGVWELTFVPRLFRPVRLEQGKSFGLGLTVSAGDETVSNASEPGLSAIDNPLAWPNCVLCAPSPSPSTEN